MNILWLDKRAEEATGGKSTAAWCASGIAIDSRAVARGDLFICLVGTNNNGHDYLEMAARNGAAAALVDQAHADKMPARQLPLLVVENTRQALVDLARSARARCSAKIIAVTGSVGKTGTKEGLAKICAKLGRTHATFGNLNSQIGVPLMLARMPEDTEYGVFELGMDRPGQIKHLAGILRPDVAIITTVQPVHMEFFDGIGQIADAKSEIFSGLGPDGVAILQREHPLFHHMRARAYECGVSLDNIISFGAHRDAAVKLIQQQGDIEGSDITAMINGKTVEYRLGIPGAHQVINSLAILAAISEITADAPQAIQALAEIQPLKGRGLRRLIELEGGGKLSLIDESYNASPAAMRAALKVLAEMPKSDGGRHIAVLGDMLELGADAPRLHASLAADILALKINLVFTAGPNMRFLAAALPDHLNPVHAAKSHDLIPPLLKAVRGGDTAMIKGSLGSCMAPVVEALLQLDKSGDANRHEGQINAV